MHAHWNAHVQGTVIFGNHRSSETPTPGNRRSRHEPNGKLCPFSAAAARRRRPVIKNPFFSLHSKRRFTMIKS